MPFRLVVHGETAGEEPRIIAVSRHRATIGRAAECDARLEEVGVSHRHATVFHCCRAFLVVDEGSANGTFVGNALLAPRSARLVQTGESIRVGHIKIEVRLEERLAPPANANTVELALAMVQEMTSGTQGERATPWIAVTEGPDCGRALLLADEDKPYVIGRGSSVDLALDDERVSRRHVRVVRRGRDVFVVGLAANQLASLGENVLSGAFEVRWMPGTPLTLARTVIWLFDPVHELQQSLDSTGGHPPQFAPSLDRERHSSLASTHSAGLVAAGVSEVQAPSPSLLLERRRAPSRWNSMDAIVLIIVSVTVAGSAAILVWLFVPWRM